MKHFKQLTLIVLTLSLFLCGCGGTQANGTNDNKDNNNTNNVDINNTSIVDKNEYTFSEYISSGETIWYVTDGYGKDAEIDSIYVIESNGTVYYCSSDWTLGEAEQMDDNEILSLVKKTYKEKLTEQINKRLSSNTVITDVYDYEILSDISSAYDSYLAELPPAPYKLSVITDSTGNNSETEWFVYRDAVPLYPRNNVGFVCIPHIIELQAVNGCAQVYDSWYGVYRCELEDSYGDKYFLTRIDSEKTFYLDEVGTENVSIDVDSKFSLFDENDNIVPVQLKILNVDE